MKYLTKLKSYLCLKLGESHNHNDVGNFVIYVDGQPAVIDVGGGTYNAKYFGPDRYTIWNLQSQWHTCPTINGVQQHAGIKYKANNVSYTSKPGSGTFVADLSAAYPKEAAVKSWVRSLVFDGTKDVINMSETYSLEKVVKPFELNFVTVLDISYEEKSGEVVLKNDKIKLTMNFDKNLFDVKTDRPPAKDPKIINIWGDRITRVTLVSKKQDIEGHHSITFHI